MQLYGIPWDTIYTNNTIPRVNNPIIQPYSVRAVARSLRYDTHRIMYAA